MTHPEGERLTRGENLCLWLWLGTITLGLAWVGAMALWWLW